MSEFRDLRTDESDEVLLDRYRKCSNGYAHGLAVELSLLGLVAPGFVALPEAEQSNNCCQMCTECGYTVYCCQIPFM